jgi:hypothetical protein
MIGYKKEKLEKWGPTLENTHRPCNFLNKEKFYPS